MNTKEIAFGIFTTLLLIGYCIVPVQSETVIKSDNMVIDSIIKEEIHIVEENVDIYYNYVEYPYTVSDRGKQFIKSHEDLRLEVYDDPTPQKRSIGWGHQLLPGENFKTITKEKAEELFEKDIKKIEASVNRLLKNTNQKFKYTQGFIDGLASLVYNCGEYGVSTTEFYERLLKCRYDGSEFNNINEADLNFTLAAVKTSKVFCEGHRIRRINEYNMMIN